MKKLTILVTALCLTALTACSTNQANSSQSAQPSQSAQTSQPAEPAQSTAPATEAKSIKPTPVANIDLEHPQEGFNAPVSFAAADVKKDGDKITLTMKVYEQELFDAVEVSQLKAGDTITAGGEEVKITKIEEIKTGGVAVNGRLRQRRHHPVPRRRRHLLSGEGERRQDLSGSGYRYPAPGRQVRAARQRQK